MCGCVDSMHKDQEEYILKEGYWTKKEEDEIKNNKDTLISFEMSYRKEHLKSRRIAWLKELKDIRTRIKELENKKSTLLGNTAESYAVKKSNEYHIKKSLFNDKNLTILAFDDEKFEEFDEKEIEQLVFIYSAYSERFESDNLKKLALSSFFLNLFSLSSDDPRGFYGKPVAYLTFYQSELFSLGRYFKSILAEYGQSLTSDLLSDPDKLIEYIEIHRNYKELQEGSEEMEAGGIVGATKEDLEYLGIKTEAKFNLGEELKKSGGKLDMEKLFQLHS